MEDIVFNILFTKGWHDGIVVGLYVGVAAWCPYLDTLLIIGQSQRYLNLFLNWIGT